MVMGRWQNWHFMAVRLSFGGSKELDAGAERPEPVEEHIGEHGLGVDLHAVGVGMAGGGDVVVTAGLAVGW
jgi:hypothetical protein